ncbi:MAG: type VI secretion system domain-containing protein [bacterium]
MENNLTIATLGLQPIADDKPTGNSARYASEFDILGAEILKLESNEPDSIDWAKVEELSVFILQTISKDLLVASFLCEALFIQQNFDGLSIGFTILRDMLKEYWDSLFPEIDRMKGRISAIEWLIKQLSASIPQKNSGPSNRQRVIECSNLWEEIDALLQEKLKDNTPDSSKIKDLFQNRVKEQEKDTCGSPRISDTKKALLHAQATLIRIAALIRTKHPENPLPYRIVRAVTWMMLDHLPPAKNQITDIQEISSSIRTSIEKDLQSKDWLKVINCVEDIFVKYPFSFWLEGHKYSIQAMEKLGPSYSKARLVIIEEFAHFIRRFPDIVTLRFSNGAPFASEQTKQWIKNEIACGTGPIKDTDFFSLEHWDPVLSVEVIYLLLHCYYRGIQKETGETPKVLDEEMRKKCSQLYGRLCQLDLEKALQMEKIISFNPG